MRPKQGELSCKGGISFIRRCKRWLVFAHVQYIDSQKDPLGIQKEEATDLDAELAELERKDKMRQFTRLDLVR